MSRNFFGSAASTLSTTIRERIASRLEPQRFAIPVYRGTGRQETLVGSGILLAIAGVKFFCTAAHVFDALARTPLVLHGEGPAHLVKTQAHVTQLPATGRGADKYDLLIDRFESDRARWFSSHRFITVDQIDQNEIPDYRTLLYTFAGYPASANRRQGEPKLATYTDGPLEFEKYESYGFVPNLHLITGFNKKRMIDAAGKIVTPCDPHGISGGPVWRLSYPSAGERTKFRPKLVGIGLEYRPDALIALRLSLVLETIRSLYPDVSVGIPRSQWIGVNATTATQ
ncbi:MAG TPA: hypothetical protein VNA69_13335 [Thermoanaerobaculia bacterium]|nr:hypothetical protein [Thermoanaerobaculia bacterium]